jgi:hypothetical protein
VKHGEALYVGWQGDHCVAADVEVREGREEGNVFERRHGQRIVLYVQGVEIRQSSKSVAD